METKSNKGMKGIITLAVVFVLSIALVLATTLGTLTDRKTATGTITFMLADYKFQVTNSQSVSGIYPGKLVTTKDTTLINGHNNAGATAGLQPVYVRIKFNNIKIDSTEFNGNIKAEKNATTGKVMITATNQTAGSVEDMLEISIDTTKTKWGIYSGDSSTGCVYLVANDGTTPTRLESTATDATANAIVKFNIAGKEPTGSKNGFNDTTGTGGLPNKYQGQTVSILYTVEWNVSLDNLVGGGGGN